jgi:hypothetical protein
MNYFFTWHIFLEVGKTQDLPSKIWQTLEMLSAIRPSSQGIFYPGTWEEV